MSRHSLIVAGAISEVWRKATIFEPTTTLYLQEDSTIYPNLPNDWAVLWVLICTVHFAVSYYLVTYEFQSESTLYSLREWENILARIRNHFGSLSDNNKIQTQSHLVRKRTLNHLSKIGKWLSSVVSIYLYCAFECVLLPCHVRVWEWIHALELA